MATQTMNTTVDTSKIREHMPIVCSEGVEFGTVDHLDGNSIKVTKDEQRQHHWIPLSWVARVDDHVHIDRPGKQAMQEWFTGPPNGNR